MAKSSQPISNPQLVAAMENLQHAGQNEEAALLNALKEARLLAPIVITPDSAAVDSEGKMVLKEDTTISFQSVENEEGERFFLAFTDWAAVFQWRNQQDQQTLAVTFDDLSSLLAHSEKAAHGFIINPQSHNLIIRKEIIHSPRDPIIFPLADKGVLFGKPRKYSQAMLEAVKAYLTGERGVGQAFFMLMMREEKHSFLIVIDGERRAENRKRIYEEISRIARPFLQEGQYLDLASTEDGLGKEVTENWEPFYTRP